MEKKLKINLTSKQRSKIKKATGQDIEKLELNQPDLPITEVYMPPDTLFDKDELVDTSNSGSIDAPSGPVALYMPPPPDVEIDPPEKLFD
jgi:hypothetical protein